MILTSSYYSGFKDCREGLGAVWHGEKEPLGRKMIKIRTLSCEVKRTRKSLKDSEALPKIFIKGTLRVSGGDSHKHRGSPVVLPSALPWDLRYV